VKVVCLEHPLPRVAEFFTSTVIVSPFEAIDPETI